MACVHAYIAHGWQTDLLLLQGSAVSTADASIKSVSMLTEYHSFNQQRQGRRACLASASLVLTAIYWVSSRQQTSLMRWRQPADTQTDTGMD